MSLELIIIALAFFHIVSIRIALPILFLPEKNINAVISDVFQTFFKKSTRAK